MNGAALLEGATGIDEHTYLRHTLCKALLAAVVVDV